MNLTEEQRRKVNQFIAEKRGWTRIETNLTGLPYWKNPKGIYVGGGTNDPIPDYTRSLDACHEAELSLIVEKGLEMDYREKLGDVCGQYAIIWFATAEQRAVALFLTLGGEL